jgi:hypothetical protein
MAARSNSVRRLAHSVGLFRKVMMMMRKGILAFSVFSALLLALFVSRVNGQTQAAQPAPNLVVMCGNCEGSLFGLTAERGMLLMKAGRDGAGELWFYSYTTETKPKLVGHLPAVGTPIGWGRRAPHE